MFRDFEELTREEVLALKDGDVVFMESSWGMTSATYPHLGVETHRNMFWSKQLNDLGYTKPADGVKTVEMLRDYGPLYKLKEGHEKPDPWKRRK